MSDFDDIVSECGGKYHYAPGSREDVLISDLLRYAGPRIRAGRKNGQPMQLEVCIVDASDCNAWAFSDDDKDYIALNKGIIDVIPKLYDAVLSYGLIYPDVGKIKKPYVSQTSAVDVASDGSGWVVPKLTDPHRKQLRNQLSMFTYRYIFEHELAHIYNGHTDWLGTQGRLAAIFEMAVSGLPAFSGIERQTFEWDADSFAVQVTLQDACQPIVITVDGVAAWKVSELKSFGGSESAMTATGIACQILHYLFMERTGLDFFGVMGSSHPHPALRALQIIGDVTNVMTYRTGERYSDRVSFMDAAVVDLNRVWMKIFPDDTHLAHLHSDLDIISLDLEMGAHYRNK